MLYASKRFLDKASKTFGLGSAERKRMPLIGVLKAMNVPFRELGRGEAKEALDRIKAESRGMIVTTSQVVKHIAPLLLQSIVLILLFTGALIGHTALILLAFILLLIGLPITIPKAMSKTVAYRSGAETEDSVILEFLASVPRAFRSPLVYDIWIIVPKSEAGEAKIKRLIKAIVEKTGVEPLTEEEWGNLQPLIEGKLKGKLEVKGVTENLWKTL